MLHRWPAAEDGYPTLYPVTTHVDQAPNTYVLASKASFPPDSRHPESCTGTRSAAHVRCGLIFPKNELLLLIARCDPPVGQLSTAEGPTLSLAAGS